MRRNNLLKRMARQLGRILTGSLTKIRPVTLLLFTAGLVIVWIMLEAQINGLITVSEQLRSRQAAQGQALSKANDEINATDETILTLKRRLNLSVKRLELESRMTKDELLSLRDGLTEFLNENSRSEESVNSKLGLLEKQLGHTTDRLTNNLEDVYRLKESLNHHGNQEELYDAVLLPSVRIKTKGNVGGGIIIYSQPYIQDELFGNTQDKYQTYVLTAYHVVKGMLCDTLKQLDEEIDKAIKDKKLPEITIDVYRQDFSTLDEFKAEIVAFDEAKDLAILYLKTTRQFKQVARFIPKSKISQVKVFSRVYAVGCPLGYEPLPTGGEVASLTKQMNGEKFWVMNAPTIFGNSGGGIFLADTYELIGISSMVCVYNQVIPTPITHLGLMVPADNILNWLDNKGLAFLYNPDIRPLPADLIVRPGY